MSQELTKVVAIDHMSGTYLEAVERRRAIKVMEAELARLERKLRAAIGDNEAATIFGEEVITNRPVKKLRAKQLAEDNPVLYKQYTRPMLVDQFDAEAFQADHPNLYEQYRSRQFLYKENK